MAEKAPSKIDPATAPDPEEDDLDDLDDVLDEFQSTSISEPPKAASSSTAPTASGPGRPPASKDGEPSEEDFAKQLQAGMSSLISELDSNPDMQAEFEKMMQELIKAGAAGDDQEAGEHLKQAAEAVPKVEESNKPKAAASSGSNKKGASGGDNFQDTIQRTMQRMQASDTGAKAASSAPQSEEDLLAQMMKELTEGGAGGMGGGEDFNQMLMSMMAHLTNKDILYEPMKELHEKFPSWLEKNSEKTPKEELDRYREQKKLVGEIVGRFERSGYSDDNEEDREYIVERMQQVGNFADRLYGYLTD